MTIDVAAALERAIKAAGVPIAGVSIGDAANKATWAVRPPNLQAAAQPTIEAFNVVDLSHAAAELTVQVRGAMDEQRLSSALVWTILKQMYPADTDGQTKTKYGVARQRIIDAFQAQPWT